MITIKKITSSADIKEDLQNMTTGNIKIQEAVKNILSDVAANGKEAVYKYTKEFDKVDLNENNITITRDDMKKATEKLDKELLQAILNAAANIRNFHENQKEKSFFCTEKQGIITGQIIKPLKRVGIYSPNGTAAYPSSVLMNAIPAKVAGVKEIIMFTPPKEYGVALAILAAAYEAGVDRIYTIGGAQAIACMAYGIFTQRVDKITGPGNAYVAEAKKQVYGICGIDSIAGPSEILIIADESAVPSYVAADMLSQAEHDILARSILVTDNQTLAESVAAELKKQVSLLPRKETAEKSILANGRIYVVPDISAAFDISNEIAPEHLELCINEPFSYISTVQNAGAIFIGNFTPEPVGDYYAGTNHILPTSGAARFFSPLGVYDFIKRTSLVSYDREALLKASGDISVFASSEGLDAHKEAVLIRTKQ